MEAPVAVVCDQQNAEAVSWGAPMSNSHKEWLRGMMLSAGLDPALCRLITLCPPVSEEDRDSAKR